MPRRSRASRTAVKVAKGVVLLGYEPEIAPLLPPDAAATSERLLRAAGQLRGFEVALFRRRWFRALAHSMEHCVMPGQSLAGALRKRFFDDQVRVAIAAGARQVLAVGAGFDSLCVRLSAALPATLFAEVDTPPTRALKARAIDAIGATRPNLHLIGADLATAPLAEVVAAIPGWRADATTVAIAEGVLMYLDQAAVASLLRQLSEVTGPGSRLVLSYMLTDAAGRVLVGPRSRFVRALFRAIGEPLRWGLPPDTATAFFAAHGYRLDGPLRRDELTARYLAPAGLAGRALSSVEQLAIAFSR